MSKFSIFINTIKGSVMTLTNLVSALSMGMTVFLGQKIGEKKADVGGDIVANGIILFFSIGVLLTILIPVFASGLASLMNAPVEASIHYYQELL
ncbi:MATE family efflux transporter [Butyrivibrio sp. VCD2006]|uniref:MATE family efflux transporter n=1 Tax=Butyrivibrio sp. VCD2006 TaxID=1280664 RepID=UPI00047C2F4E|nr:MATE family efflux transporter [Butyrivibrio sp. VCD2006]